MVSFSQVARSTDALRVLAEVAEQGGLSSMEPAEAADILSRELVQMAQEGHADLLSQLLRISAEGFPFPAECLGKAFQTAMAHGKPAVCKVLLSYAADDRPAPSWLQRALLEAASAGCAGVAQMLVAAGASTSAADCDGCTALHRAAAEGSADVCKMLLEAGADATRRDATFRTPLHAAASRGHGEVCDSLLQHLSLKGSSRDLDGQDKYGSTAAHLAATARSEAAVRALLAAGASLARLDSDGLTPLGVALKVDAPAGIISLLTHPPAGPAAAAAVAPGAEGDAAAPNLLVGALPVPPFEHGGQPPEAPPDEPAEAAEGTPEELPALWSLPDLGDSPEAAEGACKVEEGAAACSMSEEAAAANSLVEEGAAPAGTLAEEAVPAGTLAEEAVPAGSLAQEAEAEAAGSLVEEGAAPAGSLVGAGTVPCSLAEEDIAPCSLSEEAAAADEMAEEDIMSTLETLLPTAARYSTALLDTLGSEAAEPSPEPLGNQQSVAAVEEEVATQLAKSCSLQEQPRLAEKTVVPVTDAAVGQPAATESMSERPILEAMHEPVAAAADSSAERPAAVKTVHEQQSGMAAAEPAPQQQPATECVAEQSAAAECMAEAAAAATLEAGTELQAEALAWTVPASAGEPTGKPPKRLLQQKAGKKKGLPKVFELTTVAGPATAAAPAPAAGSQQAVWALSTVTGPPPMEKASVLKSQPAAPRELPEVVEPAATAAAAVAAAVAGKAAGAGEQQAGWQLPAAEAPAAGQVSDSLAASSASVEAQEAAAAAPTDTATASSPVSPVVAADVVGLSTALATSLDDMPDGPIQAETPCSLCKMGSSGSAQLDDWPVPMRVRLGDAEWPGAEDSPAGHHTLQQTRLIPAATLASFQGLATQVQQLVDCAAVAEREAAELRQQLWEAEQRVAAAEGERDAVLQLAQGSEQLEATLTAERQEAVQGVEEAGAQVAQLRGMLEARDREIKQLALKLHEATLEITTLRTQLEAKDSEKRLLQGRLEILEGAQDSCSIFTAAELELIQESMEGALARLRKRATEQRVQEALLLHGVHDEEVDEEY